MDKNPTPPIPQLTGEEEVVMLFAADTNEGKAFFAYIRLTMLKLGEFYEAQENGAPIDLNSFGEVVETGWGYTPPAQVHERIVAKYGTVFPDGKVNNE